MSVAVARVLAFVILAASGACTAPVKDMAAAYEAVPVTSIYLVSHGWHVGMVVRQTDIPGSVWPWSRDFPDAKYLEFGWGDRTFYQARNPHLASALKAALLPTESVLHIFGFSGSLTANFPYSEIIEIELPPAGMQRLAGYIAASFSRDDAGNITSLSGEFPRNRRFYPSRETYHLFNTCNVWAARALHTAGLSITPGQAMTAEGLMSQVRRIGTVVQSSSVVAHFASPGSLKMIRANSPGLAHRRQPSPKGRTLLAPCRLCLRSQPATRGRLITLSL